MLIIVMQLRSIGLGTALKQKVKIISEIKKNTIKTNQIND